MSEKLRRCRKELAAAIDRAFEGVRLSQAHGLLCRPPPPAGPCAPFAPENEGPAPGSAQPPRAPPGGPWPAGRTCWAARPTGRPGARSPGRAGGETASGDAPLPVPWPPHTPAPVRGRASPPPPLGAPRLLPSRPRNCVNMGRVSRTFSSPGASHCRPGTELDAALLAAMWAEVKEPLNWLRSSSRHPGLRDTGASKDMEKELKVDSNLPLGSSSQEVTKDLLDIIGEYRALRLASPRGEASAGSGKTTHFSSVHSAHWPCSWWR
ncbi:hypothetical protein QTO34_007378 [Cnephaeus nilssonii]|uniref:Uncharacterized protein n=1 Tax=Cnephaeus nilssonii TaxID=3371016 RepID=A0AA40HK51_CNENI|nr:hypothetical protein QTO34_007378 [Eptesicus nilssonii]